LHSKLSDAVLRYPIMKLTDVRQKLCASGFSEEEALRPDQLKACKVLPVDAVFQTTLLDFRSKNIAGWINHQQQILLNI
jgi:hypothetical protein